MAVHPNSLKNLRPFTSETAPRGGVQSLGGAVRQALSAMRDMDQDELQALVDDRKTPAYRLIAAKRILAAIEQGADFDRVVNTTDGMPTQRTEQETTHRYVRTVTLPPADTADAN